MRLLLAALGLSVALLASARQEPMDAPLRSPCGPTPITKAIPGTVMAYGDSIATGGWPERLGWGVDAQGCRTLHDDRNAAKRLAGADVVWLAIGTNDYYLSRWTPAEFGAAYGAMLDVLRGSRVYAQTPIARHREAPNKLGATLGDYRAAILAECSKRGWVTCVDGSGFVPAAMLPDGVHPSGEGQVAYAAAVQALTNQGTVSRAE